MLSAAFPLYLQRKPYDYELEFITVNKLVDG